MRLKRVRIFGFKTFADKTEVNLEGGIIAVVGPNGCGKSNLVDAILWGLGEGNSRHLRAQSSQDVIFGGSARRKPVGYAEVSLLFDNEDGALPIDTAEVTVTRRLSRSGDSDYFINRRACRQRDIHELLADSGLGRAGYAIVGQKEIDQALAASPEERRAWVDEAAGVQRYRARKHESIKRLASAKEHLARVDDILHELDSQREPLRQEAEVAKRYKSAVTALREVETGLLIQEFARAAAEVAALELKLAGAAETARKESDEAERLDGEVLALRERISDLEDGMERLRRQLQDAISSAEKASSGVELAEERLRSLDELEQTLLAQRSEEMIAEAHLEHETCKADEEDARAILEQARQELAGAGSTANEITIHLKAAEAALTEARRNQSLRLKELAEQEHREERRQAALRELEGAEQDLPKLQAAQAGAAEAAEECVNRETQAKGMAAAAETQLRELEASHSERSARLREILGEKAALEGRMRGIEATIATHEGLAQGTRAVLDAAASGTLSAEYIPVGEAVETKKEFALAIETALGASANDVIVESERDAKAAIQYLKEKRLGRATFQPIPLMRRSDPSPELRRLTNDPGVLGRASDLVTCNSKFGPVVESLLGRVLIVRDIDASLRLAKKTGGWSRLVTLDGEVVYSSGAVTGGTSSRQQYGMVQRKSDLDQLKKQVQRLDVSLHTEQQQAQTFEETRAVLQAKIKELRTEFESSREASNEAKQYLQSLTHELHQAERSRDRLLAELEKLSVAFSVRDEPEVEALQSQRDDLMQELAARSADANQAKQLLDNAEQRLRQARSRLEAAAKRLDAAQRSETSRAAKLQNLGPERAKLHAEIDRLGAERDAAFLRRQQIETDLRAHQSTKDALLQKSIEAAQLARAARENLAALAAANHQAELARARADAKRAAAEERLLEEYGIGADEASKQASEVVVPPDAQPLVTRLRREIKAMGDVNVGAIDAFDRLSSRHEELSAQREDITEGIEQVQASMLALDKLTRDQFLQTFAQVETAYTAMFQKLFGGGEGKIFLDNPGNVLESGIEIEVTLPGKKRQRLELLSGGERALCAAGFLFALLHTKPSPLVVLDEVDAPLDGRNVERFADVLTEFTDRTQFIVITHNPTTIERAPVWLGVTMQEPGVSTLVPARLPTEPKSTAPTQAVVNSALAPA